MTTLLEIRAIIERGVKDTLENDDVIIWCNDAQSELLLMIELPASAEILINTNDLAYTEPGDIKRINRMWLTSERDAGLDRDIPTAYRRYNGLIIFETRFDRDDTLNVDYYKNLTYFTDIMEEIELEDRYNTLYTSYGLAQYYDQPSTIDRVGEQQARRQYEKHYGRHLMIKDQIAILFNQQTQPSTIKEVW